MNEAATNYDPNATIAGICEFADVVYDLTAEVDVAPVYVGGCTDPNADNYDVNADYDDNSCQFQLAIEASTGCMNEAASNYDPNATIAGVCEFPEVVYEPTADFEAEEYVGGCINPSADNFDENADFDDGSCVFDSRFGCTESGAQNYDPNALFDDGNCVFVPIDFEPESITYGCTYQEATNFNPQAEADDGSCTFTAQSCSINQPVDVSQQAGLGTA